MKRFGRKNRPYYRICATDIRSPRDGRIIEEIGTYDPLVAETDARTTLNADRVEYWLSVGATPSARVSVLIRKYGKDGTHLDAQQQALNKLAARKATAVTLAQESARKAAVAETKRREELEAKRKADAEAAAAQATAEAAQAADSAAAEAPADDADAAGEATEQATETEKESE
jgi:small subunit ribosomal protein S16